MAVKKQSPRAKEIAALRESQKKNPERIKKHFQGRVAQMDAKHKGDTLSKIPERSSKPSLVSVAANKIKGAIIPSAVAQPKKKKK